MPRAGQWKVRYYFRVIPSQDFVLTKMVRYRKRSDFTSDDYRLGLPRFSEENFPKNIELVDKFQSIADRLNATPAQVARAWILAEHPHCPLCYVSNVDHLLIFPYFSLPHSGDS